MLRNLRLIPFLLALTACIVATTPTVTPRAIFTTAPASPTQTPPPIATLTVISTQQLAPTLFHPPTPSELPNPAASNPFNAEPATSVSTREPYDLVVVSPNGEFIAKLNIESPEPSGKPTIRIWDKQGVLLWAIPYQGELSTYSSRAFLTVYKWARDSSALYFYYPIRSPDGGGPILADGFDLQKINVQTGVIRRVLPGGGLMAFALSPDERSIAYIRDNDHPRHLIIRDLTMGSEQTPATQINFEEWTQAGWIFWSPSGNSLVFHVGSSRGLQAIYVNIKAMQQALPLLLNRLTTDYSFDGWTPDENLRFRTYPDNTVVVIDVKTGTQSLIGTVTPTPLSPN